jgi:KipI family sensor histidine kinase inhibitor
VTGIRFRRAGDRALLAYPSGADEAETSARVRALDRALHSRPADGVLETVPAVESLLVLYQPDVLSFEDACAHLARAAEEPAPDAEPGRLHEVPVAYGGEHGPDLDEVARACGLDADAFVEQHVNREYRALMLGFRPGFAYLGWLPDALRTSRRATPRVSVPGGSVAVAGLQTAVYPTASAGGWNLIGRTGAVLFDPLRDPPALVAPDDRVRFVPRADALAPNGEAADRAVLGAAIVEVLDGGWLTTVQDRGRQGFRRFGVSSAGALDPLAADAANAAVGNTGDAALLECTSGGPTLRFLAAARFAIAGADLGATLERADMGEWRVPLGTSVFARTGNVLRFSERVQGCRAYLALGGGVDVPRRLGSRSTDLPGGFGGYDGRPLRAGDRLSLGWLAGVPGTTPLPEASDEVTVRVVLGPQDDHFAAATIERFLASPWVVGPDSDRAGCRLTGPALEHAGPSEIASEGMVPGSIQVPPDGRPIVMLADGPTTGGYPKIATVVSADVARLAQLVPGSGRVRFREKG